MHTYLKFSVDLITSSLTKHELRIDELQLSSKFAFQLHVFKRTLTGSGFIFLEFQSPGSSQFGGEGFGLAPGGHGWSFQPPGFG